MLELRIVLLARLPPGSPREGELFFEAHLAPSSDLHPLGVGRGILRDLAPMRSSWRASLGPGRRR